MTISGSQNNMLFMLASLACGQKESTSMVTHRIPFSDTSDDETIAASPRAKNVVAVRRRRRALQKRRSNSVILLESSIRPRLLQASTLDVGSKIHGRKASRRAKLDVPEVVNRSTAVPQSFDEEMPSLVSDDAGWEKIHAPLALPYVLPGPEVALKNVKSINLRIQVR